MTCELFVRELVSARFVLGLIRVVLKWMLTLSLHHVTHFSKKQLRKA